MTTSKTTFSNLRDSDKAGEEIGQRLRAKFTEQPPDALIVFASSKHDYGKLLKAIDRTCHPKVMIGCSSAGEFTNDAYNEGAASVVAIRSTDIKFHPVLGRGLRSDRANAARAVVDGFSGTKSHDYAYRSALVLTDALAGNADDFVERLTTLTAGTYQLFGGGAGDDANFTRTHVFFGTEAVPDAAVALEILSNKPIGVGVRHGWEPGSPAMRVTEADGMRLISIDNSPAVEVFQEFAEKTQQTFSPKDPIPFFLHNVIGIDTAAGYRLRVPLAVNPDGSIHCAADIPAGVTIHIMKPKPGSALAATQIALEHLKGGKPSTALFFDCVATRLRMGGDFGFELDSVKQALNGSGYAGCNTYGQIARSDGQFSGFHNCTAVVAILPE
jgi:hypothetical protein